MTSYNILFLCTGNSARSILGEALATQLSGGRFKGYSAGSNPQGRVHPLAQEICAKIGYSTRSLRSKSWNQFVGRQSPKMDLVITVDTAMAHLAGALGVSVWVLIPQGNDWRWLHGRSDSPWYPTLRLFRQARNRNWTPIISDMANDLHKLAAAHFLRK